MDAPVARTRFTPRWDQRTYRDFPAEAEVKKEIAAGAASQKDAARVQIETIADPEAMQDAGVETLSCVSEPGAMKARGIWENP